LRDHSALFRVQLAITSTCGHSTIAAREALLENGRMENATKVEFNPLDQLKQLRLLPGKEGEWKELIVKHVNLRFAQMVKERGRGAHVIRLTFADFHDDGLGDANQEIVVEFVGYDMGDKLDALLTLGFEVITGNDSFTRGGLG
jgi:hypothetical protein